MFCYQCEQTAKGTGCTVKGVCGKTADVSDLQDLLIYCLMGLSQVADAGRKVGVSDREADVFTVKSAFSTLTNVDFDPERFRTLIHESVDRRDKLLEKIKAAGSDPASAFVPPEGPATFVPESTAEGLVKQGREVGLNTYPAGDPDILSLKHTVLFGLKGVCAYADHAQTLGREEEELYAYIHEALAAMQRDDMDLNEWLQMTMRCGKAAIQSMALLDAGNTERYGHPLPTRVPLGHKAGKAVLVSGHDLKDLEELLKQTRGKGVYVYTHGEMLPTHGYPELKKYEHFYGHYGTAWQNQKKEFAEFPGAIVMTTNCIQKPRESYEDNIFTTGLVGWPGIRHISGHDYQPVIDKALEMPGFPEDENDREITTGFARNAVLAVADQVIEGIKPGAVRHFFLVAGCDGAKPGRNYYTEFVEKVPGDCIVITLACGKFRFFDKNLGDIDGIPRLLDAGQCNDAYSAIQIASALSDAFGVGLNELPLSMVLSWYEQKAVCILLALLYLGIQNIRLGPSLPAFFSPNVLDTLVKYYDIKPVRTPEEDLQEILGQPAAI